MAVNDLSEVEEDGSGVGSTPELVTEEDEFAAYHIEGKKISSPGFIRGTKVAPEVLGNSICYYFWLLFFCGISRRTRLRRATETSATCDRN
jgi:hypothetical protein